MEIVVLTDIHGNISKLESIADELKSSGLVLITGDITHFGKEQEAKMVIDAIRKYNRRIFAISGNVDHPDVEKYLVREILSINQVTVPFRSYNFIGLSGSLETPFNTPNELTEEDFEKSLDRAIKQKKNDFPLVLASHHPPHNTKMDKLMYMKHAGSKSVRNFIERYKPLACFCGHIHEAYGTDKIGETQIINPGSFRSGFYAKAYLDNQSIEVELKKV